MIFNSSIIKILILIVCNYNLIVCNCNKEMSTLTTIGLTLTSRVTILMRMHGG